MRERQSYQQKLVHPDTPKSHLRVPNHPTHPDRPYPSFSDKTRKPVEAMLADSRLTYETYVVLLERAEGMIPTANDMLESTDDESNDESNESDDGSMEDGDESNVGKAEAESEGVLNPTTDEVFGPAGLFGGREPLTQPLTQPLGVTQPLAEEPSLSRPYSHPPRLKAPAAWLFNSSATGAPNEGEVEGSGRGEGEGAGHETGGDDRDDGAPIEAPLDGSTSDSSPPADDAAPPASSPVGASHNNFSFQASFTSQSGPSPSPSPSLSLKPVDPAPTYDEHGIRIGHGAWKGVTVSSSGSAAKL